MNMYRKLRRQEAKMRKQQIYWEREKEIYKKEKEIRDLKCCCSPFKKLTTTKLIVLFIFVNCVVVEIYSMWVMFRLSDLSSLYSLITAVIGESVTFAIYASKSKKENSKGGIIYDSVMNSQYDSSCGDSDGQYDSSQNVITPEEANTVLPDDQNIKG